MVCKKCETKNSKDTFFCKKCGKKLNKKEKIKKVEKKIKRDKKIEPNFKEEKPIKKNRKKIIIPAIILIILGVLGFIINYNVNPRMIVTRYYNALIKADTNRLYDFYEIEFSIFTSREMFQRLYRNTTDLTSNWDSFSIIDSKFTVDRNEVTFDIRYTIPGSDNFEYTSVTLRRTTRNIFKSNWIVLREFGDTVENFIIETFRDSKVTIEGVLLGDKYRTESGDKDIYTIPLMFATFYNVRIETVEGLILEDQVRISELNNRYIVEISTSTLSLTAISDFEESTLFAIRHIYDSAIRNRSLIEMLEHFQKGDLDVSLLGEVYNRLISVLRTDGLTLEMINITSIRLTTAKVEEDGTLYIGFDIGYDFRVSFRNGNNSSRSTNIIYARYKLHDGVYTIVDIEYLPVFFSKDY